MVSCYVYGVVPGEQTSTEVEDLPAVANAQEKISLIRHRKLAAVVSDMSTERPLGTPEDLRAHARVLDTLAATDTPVLPLRFGTVVKDAQSAGRMLADGYDHFMAALERLQGYAQFTLNAQYIQDAVLREVLDERPEINQLREEIKSLPEEASYYQRIQLGQLVTEAVSSKRDMASAEIQQYLAPLAASTATSPPTADEAAVDLSFLVKHTQRAAFEQAAEDLARRWHGRIRLRLLGPLAPYDFVADAMADTGEVP
ncbi:MAG: GvpL/GvpF family gas vesicle protein [Streptomycetaceae bacterium]|nr:GvpL/GvpF family gas vesicle protein [Streptomycetaceae bacterium]